MLFKLHMFVYFLFFLSRFVPFVFLFLPSSVKSLSGSLSLTYKEKFQSCSGFLNCEYGDFLMLMRVLIIRCYILQFFM
jgi:hypothetical protein